MKICVNCSTPAANRIRVCRTCGVKAIWRKPSTAELTKICHDLDQLEDTMQKLLSGEI